MQPMTWKGMVKACKLWNLRTPALALVSIGSETSQMPSRYRPRVCSELHLTAKAEMACSLSFVEETCRSEDATTRALRSLRSDAQQSRKDSSVELAINRQCNAVIKICIAMATICERRMERQCGKQKKQCYNDKHEVVCAHASLLLLFPKVLSSSQGSRSSTVHAVMSRVE